MDTSKQYSIFIENEEIIIPEWILDYSTTVKEICSDGDNTPIPIMNVKKDTWDKIIEFYDMYEHCKDISENIKIEIDKFMSVIDKDMLNILLVSTDYLGMNILHNICCEKFADMYIKGMSVEDMRRNFNVEDNMTEEDKKELFEKYLSI